MGIRILLGVASMYMALVGLGLILANAVGFGAIATLDIWGSLGEAREFTEVFAIVHLLFTAAFVWGWRKSKGGG
jgi:hypothetical protein